MSNFRHSQQAFGENVVVFIFIFIHIISCDKHMSNVLHLQQQAFGENVVVFIFIFVHIISCDKHMSKFRHSQSQAFLTLEQGGVGGEVAARFVC